MKKLICCALLSGIIITTNAMAKCDPENARNSSVTPIWNPNTGSVVPNEYNFFFQRYCDKPDDSCSRSVEVLVTADGHTKTYQMSWLFNRWVTTEFIHGKQLSYQIIYQDYETGNFCKTSSRGF